MEHAYYVRYGLTGRVGRFFSTFSTLERGLTVVVQTHRGTELGVVLLSAPPPSLAERSAPVPSAARLIRLATSDDLASAQRAREDRHHHFNVCRQVFQDGVWPFDVIDVEPLLDDGRTVVHYLGPHDLDVAGLLAVFRAEHQLDVVFEAAGPDASSDAVSPAEASAAACGSCGAGGGCESGGCGSHEGCSDCTLMQRVRNGGRADLTPAGTSSPASERFGRR